MPCQDDKWAGNMEMLFSLELKDTLHNRYVVSSMDHLDALQNSTSTAPCKLKAKKTLLQNLFTNRETILQPAKTLGIAYNTNLHDALSHNLPSSRRILRQDNVVLSQKVLNLFEPMEVFHNHMRDQDEATGRPSTRLGEKGNPSYLPIKLSGRVVAVKEKVDKYVVEKNASSVHSLFNLVKLSQLQKAH
jgi:hypothetical protein